MTAPLPASVRDLFTPPFVPDKAGTSIRDARRHVAVRLHPCGTRWMPRGWGWMRYLPDGLAPRVAWVQWFRSFTSGRLTAAEVAAILNEAWEKQQCE